MFNAVVDERRRRDALGRDSRRRISGGDGAKRCGRFVPEAEAFLESGGGRAVRGQTASQSGFVEPMKDAVVDAAYLVTERLNAPLDRGCHRVGTHGARR